MEAVPRLPMISFELLTTTEKVAFGPKLKQYIASFYQEDPESYNNEIHTLEGLRANAVWPSIDITNCQLMKKYYCQLHFLKSRFPMEESQVASVFFSWKDDYTKMSCSMPDINFELMCILINIGAIHAKLGAEDTRSTAEGMKMSCTHFQCAAWALQTVRETYGQLIGLIMISSEQIHGMQLVCLAQAQECILEKSLLDNRKATIIAKIAVQLSDYYRQALSAFQSGDDGLVADHIPNHKYIIQYLQFKIAYHRCIALLYQGQQAEEQQKMGERVAFYQAALEALEDARKQASRMSSSNQTSYKDTLAFTLDVVEGKRKAATNENEFIYHEDVPQSDTLQEIKGASLVKGIPFNIHDIEVAGTDIFNRLVPMAAHEASSLYSEQKAQMLRKICEKVENKDHDLGEFMSSMQLEVLQQMKTAKGIPQELVDRAASMVAKPNATKCLIEAMGKLSNSYQEVEAMLKEIQELLKEEEEAEKEYQEIMGKRPPSIIATDLSREAAKYQEAHGKASESNQNLHKAMTTHVSNLKVLSQPLGQLMMQIPSLHLPDSNIDEKIVEQMETLVSKVEEMKIQRTNLCTQLRDNLHKDDITAALVTRQANQSIEFIFQQELDKHKTTWALIDQNLLAQDNICKAIVEAYAKFTPTRKYLQDVLQKRNGTISALIASYDTYDDLLAKAYKGIEFYAKLETNVSKLLQRIKSACNVQQEERDQILLKNGHTKQPKRESPIPYEEVTHSHTKPKLKDYLDSMKEKRNENVIGPQMQYPTSSMYPSQDSPVWKDSPNVNKQDYTPGIAGYHPPSSSQYSGSINANNFLSHGYTQVNYSDKNVDQTLVDKMNALKIPNNNFHYDYTNSQAYNYPVSYTASPTSTNYSMGSTNLHTSGAQQINTANYSNPPASYQTVSSTNYPYVTTSVQYTPDVNGKVPDSNPKYMTYTKNTNTTDLGAKTETMSSNYGQYPDQGSYYNYGSIASTSTQPPNNYYNYGQTESIMHPYSSNPSSIYLGGTPRTSIQTPGTSNLQTPVTSYLQNPQNSEITSMVPFAQNNSPYSQINNSYNQNNIPPSNSNLYSQNNIQQTYHQPTHFNQIPESASSSSSTTVDQNTVYNQNNSLSNASGYSQTIPGYNQNIIGTNTPNYHQSNSYQSVNDCNGTGAFYIQNATMQYPTASAMDINTSYAGVNPHTRINPHAATQQNSYSHEGTQSYPQYMSTYNPSNYSTYNATEFTQSASSNTTPEVVSQNVKKESSIDLLAGLDFSISQAPLVPQKESKSLQKDTKGSIKGVKPEVTFKIAYPELEPKTVDKKKVKALQKGDPFKNPDTVTQFLQEVDKFEKYVEGLNVKTLSGTSILDIKWKEIQDCQENVESLKRSISVARCYPLKNRSPDILPYDYSRVELLTTNDDYINASHVKDTSPCCMDFIVTQTPLQSTIADFWVMVWEQQVETIVCLLSSNELKDEVYWPADVGKELNVASKVITVLSIKEYEHWTERRLNISVPDQKESRIVILLQFTAWLGSLFPNDPIPFINFLKKIVRVFEEQKCSGDPLLIHDMAGVGRSGICCILLAAIMEVQIVACPLPDIPNLACKMSCARKNILRDREHLKFVYSALLAYLQIIKGEHTKSDKKKSEEVQVTKAPSDPLSDLDPMWATKKS